MKVESGKRKAKSRCVARRWYAGVRNGVRVTAWYLSRDKAWEVARQVKATAIQGQVFIEPAKEAIA